MNVFNKREWSTASLICCCCGCCKRNIQGIVVVSRTLSRAGPKIGGMCVGNEAESPRFSHETMTKSFLYENRMADQSYTPSYIS